MKTPSKTTPAEADPQRIAKVIARAGLCSRREAETWIAEGRVALNGRVLDTPAVTVAPGDVVTVDGQPLPDRDRTRLWLFHKPRGLVTTTRDPEGRSTVFDVLPKDLPRVMTVGRLDINTEGLLLLTNDGGLARVLELPATGWLRRYRVRAHGEIDQATLDGLRDGIAVDGVLYGAIEASLDRRQGDNVWLTMGLREGKNREIKNVLMHLGLDVNRLIRLSFGPFQLGGLAEGAVEEVQRRHLMDQLGDSLASAAGADFALREGERGPKIAKPPARPEPVEAPRPARARQPDAARSRRRHEADIEHDAESEANRRRPRLALKGAGPHAAAPEVDDRRQLSRREIAERRRAGVTRPEAVVERRPRRPDETPAEEPREARGGRAGRGARPGRPPERAVARELEGRRPAGRRAAEPGRPGEDARPQRGYRMRDRDEAAGSARPARSGSGSDKPQGGDRRRPDGEPARREERHDRRGEDRRGGASGGRGPGGERTGAGAGERPARSGKAGRPGGGPRAFGDAPGGHGRKPGGPGGPGGTSGGKPRGRGPGADAGGPGGHPERPGGKPGGKPRGPGGFSGRPGDKPGPGRPGGRPGDKPRGPGGRPGDKPRGPGGPGGKPGSKPRGPGGGRPGGSGGKGGGGADRRR